MTEEDAVVLREVGERPELRLRAARPPRDRHRAGADRHGGRRPGVSGSRFAYLKGDLVLLELALVRFAHRARPRARATSRSSRRSWSARRRSYGTGFLPGDRDQIYEIPKDELFLAGTSEVAAGRPARRRDPRRRRRCRCATRASRPASAARPAPPAATPAASSASTSSTRSRCSRSSSRRESAAEHERLLAIEERILAELEIPYRVVNVAAGDLGAPAAKKYDCEAWIPSQGRYRELTSCSNTTDYQARRLVVGIGPPTANPHERAPHAERHRRRRRAHDDRADREPAGAGRRIHATQYFAFIRRA